MGCVDCRDDQQFRFGLLHHFFKVGIYGTIYAYDLTCGFQSSRIDVTQSNELNMFGVSLRQIASPHTTASRSGSNQSNF